jgi:hypothetical protein
MIIERYIETEPEFINYNSYYEIPVKNDFYENFCSIILLVSLVGTLTFILLKK